MTFLQQQFVSFVQLFLALHFKAPSKGIDRLRLSNNTLQAQELLTHVEEKCHKVRLAII